MKILGLITEYNPFHNGHLYHLKKSKQETNSNYTVAVMSGNFVQRGAPALLDKWSRAKMAIDCGVDLVVELPIIFSCQSAELFAYGAIKLLDSFGIVNTISFGCEWNNIDDLKIISETLVNEPYLYKSLLKKSLSKGNPYPKARNIALKEFFKDNSISKNIDDIIINPNNILAIEYIKALIRIKSNIIPYNIKRVACDYSAKKLTGVISSARAIRNELYIYNNLNKIKSCIPDHTYKYLEEFLKNYGTFNKLDNYTEIILYLLRSKLINLTTIPDINEGLHNRIYKYSNKYNTINEILNHTKSKRYTYTRLQRILVNLLLNINKETCSNLQKNGPLYIRVLGANSKGLEILAKTKNKATIPIITKFSNHRKIKSKKLNQMIEIDKKATDIYFLGINKNSNTQTDMDYIISPYIRT